MSDDSLERAILDSFDNGALTALDMMLDSAAQQQKRGTSSGS